MTVNSHNEWDTLKEIVIGTVFDHNLPALDYSFKIFFHDNMFGQSMMGMQYDDDILINADYVREMEEDLEGLVRIIEDFGAKVHRPRTPDMIKPTRTPYWESTNFYALNVRDQTMIVGDSIIETPPAVRHRYFENDLLKHIFMEKFKAGAKWIQAPKPMLLDSSFDLSWAMKNPDSVSQQWYNKVKNTVCEDSIGNEIIFDAANCKRS